MARVVGAMMKVYTLKNCDSCRKALKWLDAEGISYANHDIRSGGVDESWVTPIIDALGWEAAINRRSTTWRSLSDADREGIDNAKALALILKHPTLMKRPVFVGTGSVICGFDAKAMSAITHM